MRTFVVAIVLSSAVHSQSAINPRDSVAEFTRVNRFVAQSCQEHKNVAQELVWALIWTESRYDKNAVGNHGERGLAQLMPSTASLLRVRKPTDLKETVSAVTAYISRLLRKYKGNIRLALAAYNSGEGAVDRCGCVPPASRKYVALIADDRYPFAKNISGYLRPIGEARNEWRHSVTGASATARSSGHIAEADISSDAASRRHQLRR